MVSFVFFIQSSSHFKHSFAIRTNKRLDMHMCQQSILPFLSRKLRKFHIDPETPEPRQHHISSYKYVKLQLPCLQRKLVLPALLHRLPDALCVFSSVVLVEIGSFYIGRGACVGIVEETADIISDLPD